MKLRLDGNLRHADYLWAIANSSLSAEAKLTASCLSLTYGWSSGAPTRMGLAGLVRASSLSTDAVSRGLDELLRKGWIGTVEGRLAVTRYVLHVPSSPENASSHRSDTQDVVEPADAHLNQNLALVASTPETINDLRILARDVPCSTAERLRGLYRLWEETTDSGTRELCASRIKKLVVDLMAACGWSDLSDEERKQAVQASRSLEHWVQKTALSPRVVMGMFNLDEGQAWFFNFLAFHQRPRA